jgi:hypothetical protein
MAKEIWKYPFQTDRDEIVMPLGAKIITAGMQGDDFFVWAIVDPAQTLRATRRIAMFGTGHPMTEEDAAGRFINTIFFGPLVFHVFDLGGDITPFHKR